MALTGFQIGHQCAPSSDAAIQLLHAEFPKFDLGFMTYTNDCAWSTPNVFTCTFVSKAMTDTATPVKVSRAIGLNMCDPDIPIDFWVTPWDPAVFAAFWMTAMLFVLGCWLFAKNAGVILSAIRRF